LLLPDRDALLADGFQLGIVQPDRDETLPIPLASGPVHTSLDRFGNFLACSFHRRDVLRSKISGISDGRQAETGKRAATKKFKLRFRNRSTLGCASNSQNAGALDDVTRR